jgi:hypothetical protein
MSPVGFEPAAQTRDRPQTHALDRAVTGAVVSLVTHYPILSQNDAN